MVIALTATRPRQLTAREAGRKWNFGVYERRTMLDNRVAGEDGKV